MLDYELEERTRRDLNILQMRKNIVKGKIDNQLDIKINNFSDKFNLDLDFVRNKLLNDDLFILHFIKDPQKQTFHQSLAFDYLCKTSGILNPELLPSGGSNAQYVINGNVILGSNLATSNIGKSIDFKWEYKKADGKIITCFATHTHTKSSGGSQDNQFRDVESFLKQAQSCSSPKFFFFAICDGPYYQMQHLGHSNKITYLNENYKTGTARIKALNINELESFMLANL